MSFQEEYQKNQIRWISPDEQVTEWLRPVPAGRALDLGCGEGGNSFWLAQQGWNVTSVDIAPAAVQFIQEHSQKKGYRIKAEVADARTYTTDTSFDLILLSYVHFPEEERETLFARLENQLAEGGLLIYLGLVKTLDELPPGGLIEEFPSSDTVAQEMMARPSLVVIDHSNHEKEMPIGIAEGTVQATTANVITRKGRGSDGTL